MLELSEIGFKINTKPLEDAATKLADLGVAAAKLSKDLKGLDKASTDTAISQNKINLAAEKTATQVAKTALAEEKLVQAKNKTTKATDESTASAKQNTTVLERQQAILEFMTQGYSKGQSSTLAMAKATGILTDDLKTLQDVLQSQRTLTGGDPFDKSLGALKSLQNEFKVLKEVQRLYTAEIPLTQKQMENLALDKLRLIEAMKIEGKSFSEIKTAIKGLNSEYIGLAGNINRATAADQAIVKSKTDAAKATAFLERELARVDNVLDGFNSNLNVTSSNRLLKFREQLKASGVSAGEAEQMLKKYEERLRTIDNTNKVKQSQGREEQLKYLARATSVQLGDIGISLAGGQNPFTVLIQQGDQLRGVLNQVEADGVEMKKALSLAFKQIVVGSKDVISALGMFVVGAFNDAGKAVFGFASTVTGLGPALETGRYQLTLLSKEAGFMGDMARKALPLMDSFGKAITTAFGAALGASVLVLLSLGVAFVQVTNAQDNLTRSVISSGAALGLTTTQVYELAASMGSVGATTVDAINVISKLAEGGVIGADGLKMVTKAALELENVGGRSAEKTVEIFNKLGEKPVEALSDYAVKSGLVNQAEIERINTLVKMGDEISATTEATKILSKATETEAAIIYSNLSSISRLWIDVKNGTSDAWGAVQEFAGSDAVLSVVKSVLQSVAIMAVEVWYGIKGAAESLGGLGAVAVAIMTDIKNLDSNFTMSKNVLKQIEEVDKARQDSYVTALLRINQEGEFSKEVLQEKAKGQAALAKANSEAEKSRLAHEKAMEPWRESEKKHLADVLTKEQFIANAIKEVNKGKKQGQELDKNSKDYATVVAGATREWEKANKGDKPKVSKEQKELENYSKKIAERVKDLGIEITGVAQELTKADKMLLDLADDELWKKLTPELQEHYRLKLLFISAQETAIKEQEKENKLNEDLTKIHNENREFIAKSANESAKIIDSYDLQLSLLGKSVEEQDKLTKAAALRAKIAEVEFKFSEQLVKMQEKYTAKIKEANGNQSAIFKIIGEENKERTALDEERMKTLGVLYQGVAVQASVDYYNEMQKVAQELAGVISTALFEGGQAGSKKLRDYIVNLFRKKIEVWIEANILGMMSQGGGAGSNGGIAGAAQGLLNLPSSISNGLSSLSAAGGITGLISTIGSSFTAGFGATVSSFGAATGVAIEGGLAAVATGTSSAIAGGLAQIAGALGPYALAAVALYSLFREKEYVKGTGSGVTNFDAVGNTTSKNNFGNSFDFQTKQADDYVASMQSSYLSLARTLGIETKGGSFAFGSNNSDGGKFGVGAAVGNTRYSSTDIKATPEALQLEASRAVFAALKGSDLPAYMSTLFSSFTAETATGAEIENVLKYASTLKSVRDGLTETRKPLDVLKENLDKTFVTLGTTSETFKTDFIAAIDAGIGPDALASWVAAGNAMAVLKEETDSATLLLKEQAKALAETNKGYQDQLDILTGVETERSLQLRDATDESTKSIIRQIHTQQDLIKENEELNTKRDREKTAIEDLLKTHRSLTDQLAVLKGTETSRSLALRDATDPTTRSLLEQIYAQEDLNDAAKNAKTSVDKVVDSLGGLNQLELDIIDSQKQVETIRAEATQNYLNAQQQVTSAQEKVADALKSTIDSFKGFLGKLDNAEGPTGRLLIARKNFDDLSTKARTGDAEAIGQLTGSADTFLGLSKSYSATIQDYRRDEAKVRAIMQEGIDAGNKQLKTLPLAMQASTDPLKAAYAALTIANQKEEETRYAAISMLADLNVATSESATLMQRYIKALANMPNGEALAEYTKEVPKVKQNLETFGITLGSVNGKQLLLDATTGLTAETLELLGLTLGEVDGKQILLNKETGKYSDALTALGLKTGFLEGKQILLTDKTIDSTAALENLGLRFKEVDGKQVLMKIATDGTTKPLVDLGISAGLTKDALTTLTGTVPKVFPALGDASIKTALETFAGLIPKLFPELGNVTLKDSFEKLAKVVPVLFPTLGDATIKKALEELAKIVPTQFPTLGDVPLKLALEELAKAIPKAASIPDIAGFYSGVQIGMNSALALAQASANAAAGLLSTLQTQVSNIPVPTAPAVTTLLGSKGLSFSAGNLTKDWEGTVTTVSAGDAAGILNEYGTAWGTEAATARAIEGGATEAILAELRKYSDGLPKFDGGTNYIPQDMDVRVHKGEAIIPAAFNSNSLGGSQLMETLLNNVVVRLENIQKVNSNENNAIISNTGRILTKLDRLSPDGDAFNVSVIKTV